MSSRLLIAPGGMLGTALGRMLAERGLEHEAIGRPGIDIADPESVARAIGPDTELVFNAAAYTDVDGAEADEHAARAVNELGVANLAARCAEVGALLVHYSTDYVFNGEATRPYPVDHPRDPINAYGRSKCAGERALEASGADYLLLRTSWLYAPWGKNFARTMAALVRSKESLKVVVDQRGRPTSAEHLARTTLALLGHGARGIFHVTDGGACTWHGFATEIAARLAATCRVDPCTSAEFPRPAPRPAYSVLELSRTEDLVGPMPAWQENLAAVLARIPAE